MWPRFLSGMALLNHRQMSTPLTRWLSSHRSTLLTLEREFEGVALAEFP
jgi:hypothetical protein